MKLYLDNNIIVDIEKGLISLDDILYKLNTKAAYIFFSAAHIEESLEITCDTDDEKSEMLKKRFKTISSICKTNYLYNDMNKGTRILLQTPQEVYDDLISSHSLANVAMKGLANFIPDIAKKAIREELGLDPRQMNNYTPSEVIDHINHKFTNSGYNGTMLDMLQQVKALHPDGQSFGLSNDIAGIFELLNMVGYWKDKVTTKSNFARLWDSNHTFFAAHCNYFISDDKRTRNKAKVVYKLFNIETKVSSSKGE